MGAGSSSKLGVAFREKRPTFVARGLPRMLHDTWRHTSAASSSGGCSNAQRPVSLLRSAQFPMMTERTPRYPCSQSVFSDQMRACETDVSSHSESAWYDCPSHQNASSSK